MEMIYKRGSEKDIIRILVSLDQNYLFRFQVLLTSIAVNNPQEKMEIYLMHSDIPEEKLESVKKQCASFDYGFFSIAVDSAIFSNAPETKRYPQEMYYRLLAAHLLPQELKRILYLDPDIIVINDLRPLWETEMQGNLFAAASHTGLTELANNVNRLRLGTDSDYYNSGVLLIDLEACRKEIIPEEVITFSTTRRMSLVLPDQDILNAMFGHRILPLDDSIWNYDARKYNSYLARSSGKTDINWIFSHTVILHFCGRAKPWKSRYPYRFGLLYKHYEQLTRRWLENLE